ncbi:TPA: hypothetical protein HA251_03245 [Candidatus Woesearchaeota archaeon]|nr:hypothetical protein [Candidatus Woesearchaeota archaeon]
MFDRNETDDLKTRVLNMRSHYDAQMTVPSLLGDICCAVQHFTNDGEKRHCKEAYDGIENLTALYDSIPLVESHGCDDYAELFSIRDRLPRFREIVDSSLENPSEQGTVAVVNAAVSILTLKNAYCDRMTRFREEIEQGHQRK